LGARASGTFWDLLGQVPKIALGYQMATKSRKLSAEFGQFLSSWERHLVTIFVIEMLKIGPELRKKNCQLRATFSESICAVRFTIVVTNSHFNMRVCLTKTAQPVGCT
jgi:hypothetical protein